LKKAKRSRLTLHDIARDVGVHVATISRALNPRPRHAVSPNLADKIRRVNQRRASEPRHIVLPVELVVRGSARSIRETAP